MIKLKPGFHIIATIAVIAAVAEKKKLQRSQRSYETTLQRSQRQQSLRYKKFYLSDRCRCDRWRVVSIWSLNFFFSAIVAIIWKPGLIYRNNHPPFLLNCYLYALQTYRTHSSKLRLLLVKLKEYTTWLWFHCVTALTVEMTYPCSLVLACQPTPARLRFLALSASVICFIGFRLSGIGTWNEKMWASYSYLASGLPAKSRTRRSSSFYLVIPSHFSETVC